MNIPNLSSFSLNPSSSLKSLETQAAKNEEALLMTAPSSSEGYLMPLAQPPSHQPLTLVTGHFILLQKRALHVGSKMYVTTLFLEIGNNYLLFSSLTSGTCYVQFREMVKSLLVRDDFTGTKFTIVILLTLLPLLPLLLFSTICGNGTKPTWFGETPITTRWRMIVFSFLETKMK